MLNWNGKHVTDPSLCLDHARRARIASQLASQAAQNLHVDTAVEDILMYPGRLQQVFAGEAGTCSERISTRKSWTRPWSV